MGTFRFFYIISFIFLVINISQPIEYFNIPYRPLLLFHTDYPPHSNNGRGGGENYRSLINENYNENEGRSGGYSDINRSGLPAQSEENESGSLEESPEFPLYSEFYSAERMGTIDGGPIMNGPGGPMMNGPPPPGSMDGQMELYNSPPPPPSPSYPSDFSHLNDGPPPPSEISQEQENSQENVMKEQDAGGDFGRKEVKKGGEGSQAVNKASEAFHIQVRKKFNSKKKKKNKKNKKNQQVQVTKGEESSMQLIPLVPNLPNNNTDSVIDSILSNLPKVTVPPAKTKIPSLSESEDEIAAAEKNQQLQQHLAFTSSSQSDSQEVMKYVEKLMDKLDIANDKESPTQKYTSKKKKKNKNKEPVDKYEDQEDDETQDDDDGNRHFDDHGYYHNNKNHGGGHHHQPYSDGWASDGWAPKWIPKIPKVTFELGAKFNYKKGHHKGDTYDDHHFHHQPLPHRPPVPGIYQTSYQSNYRQGFNHGPFGHNIDYEKHKLEYEIMKLKAKKKLALLQNKIELKRILSLLLQHKIKALQWLS